MGKLITTLQHPDPLVNQIQEGVSQVANPLLKAWYGKLGIPGDCAASLIEKTVTMADDWIAPTLLNSWGNLGVANQIAGYRKRFGMTEIRGTIASGTMTATAFTLPVGYRPIINEVRSCCSNYAFGAFYILTTGAVVPQAGSNVFFDLTCSVQPTDPTPVPNSIFPLTFPHGLTQGKTVSTVLLADAVDTVSLAHVSSSCSWEPYGPDQIRIIDLPGLHALRTYRLTFLVFGGG